MNRHENRFFVGDARKLESLVDFRTTSVATTITSPPYWDLKNYGGLRQIGPSQTLDQYLADLKHVFSHVWRCTRKDGSLWVIVESLRKAGELVPLPFLLVDILQRPPYAWHLHDVIIWRKTHTLPWSSAGHLKREFEHVLCFKRSEKLKLNLELFRSDSGVTQWWTRYPERYHPDGKALGSVWDISIPVQGSWGRENHAHMCPLPAELVERLVLLSTQRGDIVLDPFAGTGSTLLAANRLGRRWLGVDINPSFRAAFERRLNANPEGSPFYLARGRLRATNLRLRQLKYAVVLYKTIAPTLRLSPRTVAAIVVRKGHHQRHARPFWIRDLNITFVMFGTPKLARKDAILHAATSAQAVAPLSKFQIAASVGIAPESYVTSGTRGLARYTQGTFWRQGPATPGGGKRKPLFPPIFSDIHLSEEPAYR